MAIPAPVWWILGLGGALAIAGIARADEPTRRKSRARIGPAGEHGLGDLMRVMDQADATADWKVFFAATAYTESRWQSDAWNDSAAETAASVRAWERNQDRYSHCPWSPSAYKIGSGGWFGLIPANALSAFWDTQLQCMSPNAIFEPAASFVMAVDYARRLQQWGQFQVDPSWMNLRRGWKAPRNMGAVHPGSDSRFREALGALRDRGWDIPAGWEKRPVTQMPFPRPIQLLQQLGGQS